MCGIVGGVGNIDFRSYLINGLKKLDYRGYDSAGLAVLNGSRLFIRKTAVMDQGLMQVLQLLKVFITKW